MSRLFEREKKANKRRSTSLCPLRLLFRPPIQFAAFLVTWPRQGARSMLSYAPGKVSKTPPFHGRVILGSKLSSQQKEAGRLSLASSQLGMQHAAPPARVEQPHSTNEN